MSKGLVQLQEYRNASGLKLYEEGRVYPYRNIFKVQSETDPAFFYEVDIEGATCSCPDHLKRGNLLRCKHLVSVEHHIKNQPLLLTC